jgi:uncharacterized protein YlxW (UPF0749 family)
MTLLTEMMERPLDPGYAAAAERRRTAGLTPATGTRSPLLIGAAVTLGLLLVVAALALRPAGTTASREKAQLVEQIQSRQAQGDAQAARLGALRGEITAYQQAALGSSQAGLADELARLGLVTGEVSVAGPGLVLTVDDAPGVRSDSGVDPRNSGGFPEGRVTALDLQVLTNGLWQSGAEAISINGQRLTSRSAIRFAGEAILVDFRPLTPPYVVSVIGDSRGLQSRFVATSAGSYLKALGDNFHIRSNVTASDRVEVPRSPELGLTFARPVAPGIPSASASVPPGGARPTGSASSAPPPTTPQTSERTP